MKNTKFELLVENELGKFRKVGIKGTKGELLALMQEKPELVGDQRYKLERAKRDLSDLFIK